MTDREELNRLVNQMRRSGAVVEVKLDAEGHYDSFRVTHASRIGPHWMSPLSFAERAREWIYRHACP